MSIVSLLAWLLMLLQYEYPIGKRQSLAPPQSLALVIRMPCVEYGAGNVNMPRAGSHVWICAALKRGRSPTLVAESVNPPTVEPCPCTVREEPMTTTRVTMTESATNVKRR